MNKNLYLWLIVIILIIAVIGGFRDIRVIADESVEREIIKVETKEFTGHLLSRKNTGKGELIGIAGRDSDYFFKLDKEIQVVHKRKLDDIEMGDMVSVVYDEETEVLPNGREETSRTAKVIKFIKKGEGDLLMPPGKIEKRSKGGSDYELRVLQSREDER